MMRVHYSRKVYLTNLGKQTEAIECFDKALGIKPDDAGTLTIKGFALYNLGRYNESIEWYDKVLGIKPDYEFALNGKQMALEKLGTEDKGFSSKFSNKNERKIKYYILLMASRFINNDYLLFDGQK
jgi:tetratricopeptide (TPR) repeat protein